MMLMEMSCGTRQFGTAEIDYAVDVHASGSEVYVVGSSYGAFPGQTHYGSGDAFISKYDANGNELWTRQFGTENPAILELAQSISVSTSGVYVSGVIKRQG